MPDASTSTTPPEAGEEQQDAPLELLPVLGGYVAAILLGLVVPRAAVAVYFVIALYMILFRALPWHPSACPSRGPVNGRPPI